MGKEVYIIWSENGQGLSNCEAHAPLKKFTRPPSGFDP